MSIAYLDVGDLVIMTAPDGAPRTLVEVQTKFPEVTQEIIGAPALQAVKDFPRNTQVHRKTSGDGTLIGHYTLEAFVDVPVRDKVRVLDSTVVATTSFTTFVDAFAGATVTLIQGGKYMAFFDCECDHDGNNGEVEVELTMNGSPIVSTQRRRRADPADRGQLNFAYPMFDVLETDVFGVAFRNSGVGGSVSLYNRRLTLLYLGD